jgi:hypothetical protein
LDTIPQRLPRETAAAVFASTGTFVAVAVEEVCVYKTVPRDAEDIADDIVRALDSVAGAEQNAAYGVFFSPSGYQAATGSERTRQRIGSGALRPVAIGSTTAAAMASGVCAAVCATPTPEGVANAVTALLAAACDSRH